jgi:hypothetical protein
MNVPHELTSIEKLLDHLQENGGWLSIVYETIEPEATVSYEFGEEAPDSPMAAGASYAIADSVQAAVAKVAKEVGL